MLDHELRFPEEAMFTERHSSHQALNKHNVVFLKNMVCMIANGAQLIFMAAKNME